MNKILLSKMENSEQLYSSLIELQDHLTKTIQESRERLDAINKLLEKSPFGEQVLAKSVTPDALSCATESSQHWAAEGSVMAQIRAAIEAHFDPARAVEPTRKRGRPEYKRDCSADILKGLLRDWETELAGRLRRDQRSDAMFASVGRFVKKIPDILLKYIGSRCQFKSKKITTVLKSYLKPFTKGFLVMFPVPEHEDLVNLFLDFTLLCFPESKVRELLGKMAAEGSLSKAQLEQKTGQLRIRIKASKKSYKELFNANKCFQIICAEVKRNFSNMEGADKKKVDRVLDYLLGEEEVGAGGVLAK